MKKWICTLLVALIFMLSPLSAFASTTEQAVNYVSEDLSVSADPSETLWVLGDIRIQSSNVYLYNSALNSTQTISYLKSSPLKFPSAGSYIQYGSFAPSQVNVTFDKLDLQDALDAGFNRLYLDFDWFTYSNDEPTIMFAYDYNTFSTGGLQIFRHYLDDSYTFLSSVSRPFSFSLSDYQCFSFMGDSFDSAAWVSNDVSLSDMQNLITGYSDVSLEDTVCTFRNILGHQYVYNNNVLTNHYAYSIRTRYGIEIDDLLNFVTDDVSYVRLFFGFVPNTSNKVYMSYESGSSSVPSQSDNDLSSIDSTLSDVSNTLNSVNSAISQMGQNILSMASSINQQTTQLVQSLQQRTQEISNSIDQQRQDILNSLGLVGDKISTSTNTITTKIETMSNDIQSGFANVVSTAKENTQNIINTVTQKVDEVEKGITEVKDSILDLPNKLQEMLLGLIVPDADTMANKYSEFSGLLEEKLGVIYQIPVMLFDFFNTIVNAATTPQSTLTLPAFTLPWIDGTTLTVWNPVEFKIMPDGLQVLSDLIKTITSMTVVVLTFNSVKRAYERFLRGD